MLLRLISLQNVLSLPVSFIFLTFQIPNSYSTQVQLSVSVSSSSLLIIASLVAHWTVRSLVTRVTSDAVWNINKVLFHEKVSVRR